MKEAVGELNTTVIVVLAIGAFSAFFFTVLWPMIDNNFEESSNCSDAICGSEKNANNEVECYIKGNEDNTFFCPYKG